MDEKHLSHTIAALARTISHSISALKAGSERLTATSTASSIKTLSDEAIVLSQNLTRLDALLDKAGDMLNTRCDRNPPSGGVGVSMCDVSTLLSRLAIATDNGFCPRCDGVLISRPSL